MNQIKVRSSRTVTKPVRYVATYCRIGMKKPAPMDSLDNYLDSHYDLTDWSTLFQDVDGTIPVTDYGQPVALIKDKGRNGNHLYQPNPDYIQTLTEFGLSHEGDLNCAYTLTSPIAMGQGVTIASKGV